MMYQSMVTEFLDSEVGSILVLLVVMGLGYVTAGWLKEQSRKRRDVHDEAEHMKRELEALRKEMLHKKVLKESLKVEKEDDDEPCFVPPSHPLMVSGDKKRSSAAFSDASTACDGCASSTGDGLETDDSAWEEEDEKTAEAAQC